jgi:cobalt-zinc-cadmium efflux system protein
LSAGHYHSHHDHRNADEKRLWIALALTASFMLVEVAGGVYTGSLALLSDAAHMFTDVAALGIALAAVQIAKRPADRQRTFGYYRFEILAAAFNAVLLFLVALYILYEAYLRLVHPQPVAAWGMLAIAVLGLAVNLIAMRLLHEGQARNLNMKGAYLEVWSDALGSIGVIIAALLIHFTNWRWLDPLVAVAIGFWVLPRTWALLKESLHVLLEGVPPGMQVEQIDAAMRAVPGVAGVHDLHVWALSSGRNSLSAHIVIDPDRDEQSVLAALNTLLAERFRLHHTTVQIERETCADDGQCAIGQTGVAHTHAH